MTSFTRIMIPIQTCVPTFLFDIRIFIHVINNCLCAILDSSQNVSSYLVHSQLYICPSQGQRKHSALCGCGKLRFHYYMPFWWHSKHFDILNLTQWWEFWNHIRILSRGKKFLITLNLGGALQPLLTELGIQMHFTWKAQDHLYLI